MAVQCGVLGGGSWGTALATQLAKNGHAVTLWDRNPDRCDAINRDHRNPRYLTEIDLPDNLVATSDIDRAVGGATLVVIAVPSHALREVMIRAVPLVREDAVLCCATKGIEEGSLLTMHGVLEEVFSSSAHERLTVLGGPSFAKEMARGLPTAVVIAGVERAARFASEVFHGKAVRVYHTEDLVGVCVGGSLKNVMAIACGVSDGLGLGQNARAAIITRGLAELTRLAVVLGARPETLAGLAGLGDLVLTCTGDLSRNRRVGLGLGAGRSLSEIVEELGEVAEGVITARSARALGREVGVEMPITEQVYAVLHEGKPAAQGLLELLSRERKAERD